MVPNSAPSRSPAFHLLVACIRTDEPVDLRAAIDSEEDLAETAAFHGLPSMLYLRLREANLHSSVPHDQWRKISAAHAAFVAHELRVHETAAHAIGILRKSEIRRLLPIKGIAWAALLGDEHTPRDISDVDLVVSSSDLRPARQALVAAGFEPSDKDHGDGVGIPEHHPPALARDGVKVEIHQSLWDPGRLPGRMPPVCDMIERSREGSILGQAIRVPSSEDMALLSAALIARDRFDVRLRHYAELHWLLNHARLAPDPEALKRLAQECGLATVHQVVAEFMNELFSEALAEPRDLPARLRTALWRRLLQSADYPHAPAALFDLVDAVTRRRRPGVEQGAADDAQTSSRARPSSAIVPAGLRAGRYTLALLGSSARRRELLEEIAIRRALRA